MAQRFDLPPPIPMNLEEARALIVVLWTELCERERREAELFRENAELRARVEGLEERLRTDSSNSSRPPSSDSMKGAPKRRRRKNRSGRKRGGQPGHIGRQRRLVPVSEVDRVIACGPVSMCECGGRVRVKEGAFERRQQFELPCVVANVTEYQLFCGECERCGRPHAARLPEGTVPGMLGARAMAMVGELSGRYHVSRRGIEELFSDFFGLSMSLGTVSKTEERLAEVLASPVVEAGEYVRRQSWLHVDETGHKVAGKRAWMWVAVTQLVSVFMICFSRGAKAARELIGVDYEGVVVSDRWSAYNWLEAKQRQLCWSHLDRDFVKISEREGLAGWIGKQLEVQTGRMWRVWHRFKDAEFDRATLRLEMRPIQDLIEGFLEWGSRCPEKQTAGTCKKLLKQKASLWTFVDQEGIEPTNNTAERALRSYVVWRKSSYGTQEERGSRFTERILTVGASCRSQGRNVLDYLTEAVEAHYESL